MRRLAWTFTAALALAVVLQVAAGAYGAELGAANSDEAAHYINGLLVARYLASGFTVPPLAFAADFYRHFPKVSIGHWPPLFYAVEAAWMLLFSAARSSVILLSAVITAALATLLAWAAQRRHGWWAATAAALVLVALPLLREMTAGVLVDPLVALLDLAAGLLATAYWQRPRWQAAAGFGLAAAAASMTKGNGMAVLLVWPAMVLLMGRLAMLRRPDFWLPAPIVAVLCGPWYVATYPLAHDGFVYDVGWAYSRMAATANAGFLVQVLGAPCLLLALVGAVGHPAIERRGPAALAGAVFVFQAAVPVDLQSRYMIPALPPLILLAMAGIADLAERLPARRGLAAGALALVSLAPLLPGLTQIAVKPRDGMREAAALVLADPAAPVLIAAGAPGEGAFIAELAMHPSGGAAIVARGTKFLASADFNGGHYVGRFATADEVAAALRQAGFGFVVLDTAASSLRFAHNRLVQQAAATSHWALLSRHLQAGIDGETLVYRLPGPAAAPAQLSALACTWQPFVADGATAAFALRKPGAACPG